MRILRIAQKLYPDVVGGGPYHVHALSRDQAAMGHDITVATVMSDQSLPATEERDGYTIRRFPAIASPLGNAISPALIDFVRNSDEYGVVHAHSHLYASTVAAAINRLVGETPLAITNHGLYSQSAPRAVFELYLRTIGRMTFQASDTVFCYTTIDRDRLRARGITSSIEVIANGIDTTRFTPTGPTADNIDKTMPTILFVGRLVKGKRLDRVIDALPAIQSAVPDTRLVVCGDGPLRPELEDLAIDLDVAGTLDFLGTVPYDEMPTVYRSADVLVLPSESEGLPRTVLEALATETPVITSDLPQLREIVEDTGKTVPIDEDVGLADAVIELLTDDHMREYCGMRGRERVEEQFDWEETVRKTTAALERLAIR
ncbi:glycosyltransferase family 4 protein [Haloarchaeobius amylolyticus]|uniref:Glycosyltransferase family 4 protein n=1 Tax=Haloarchaeobius amylolyticus TaxID=1198296 RepID=A0ABD6BCI1_9EURY